MIASKFKEIRVFCESNSKPEIIKKYEKYFKDGYDGYGLEKDVAENKWAELMELWKDEMTLDRYLDLGDELMKKGRYDEKSFALIFLNSKRKEYSKKTFQRVENWFSTGVNNWATTDVLCWFIISAFLIDKVIGFDDLKAWTSSKSEWQRRAVPVALVEMDKVTKDLKPKDAFNLIRPLMHDQSEYVQKGIGTLLRGLWKKYPVEVEDFLMQWKDSCGRLIVQYATEKMDKDYRKKFRRENV